MTEAEKMAQFIDEFSRDFHALAGITTHIVGSDITDEDKTTIISGMICALLDELKATDIKHLIEAYPEMSGREDLT